LMLKRALSGGKNLTEKSAEMGFSTASTKL